jgi:hypothetical protein
MTARAIIRRAQAVVDVPPVGPLSRLTKLGLACEILATYVPALRALRTNDVNHMITAARAVRRPGPSPPAEVQRPLAIRLGWMVLRVLSILPTDSRCLIRSLVLSRLLARRGISAELVIGVRSGAEFAAHAWLEYDGRPVLPSADFDPIFRA